MRSTAKFTESSTFLPIEQWPCNDEHIYEVAMTQLYSSEHIYEDLQLLPPRYSRATFTPNLMNILLGRSITNHLDYLRGRDGEVKRRRNLCFLSPTLRRNSEKHSSCNLQNNQLRFRQNQKPKTADHSHQAFTLQEESPQLFYFFFCFWRPVLFTSHDRNF